jgi:hypothetical protein
MKDINEKLTKTKKSILALPRGELLIFISKFKDQIEIDAKEAKQKRLLTKIKKNILNYENAQE